MMIVDKILYWARVRGYTAVYGSAEQVNEMLTDVDFAASKDATAVIMHLVTDSATVDGKDSAVVAVYFAGLCDFDFGGESLLPEQERLKEIGKELLNDIRTGNEMTYSDPRWQYGYDDYAENVCWACLRVTLTASAADCIPLVIPNKDWFYFEAAQAGATVSLRKDYAYSQGAAPDLEYSRDGVNFAPWPYTTGTTPAGGLRYTFDPLTLASVGDRVYLRGDNESFGDSYSADASVFLLTKRMYCGGDIRSIFSRDLSATVARYHPMMCAYSGDHFALLNAPDIRVWRSLAKDAFNGFLAYCEAITELPSDYLPWTVLAEGCYRGMFMMSGIRKAPVLPAFIVPSRAYAFMFWECANLDEIEAHATELEEGATTNMTVGVAEDGMFRKSAAMEGWPQGADGIPDGWTVENL